MSFVLCFFKTGVTTQIETFEMENGNFPVPCEVQSAGPDNTTRKKKKDALDYI